MPAARRLFALWGLVIRMKSKQQLSLGLALAGGGFMGAVYEIGALAAVEEAIPGLDFCAAQSYVGVSAGAFIAAGLANDITPREFVRLFVDETQTDGFDPGAMLRPNFNEFSERAMRLPPLVASAAWNYATKPNGLMASFRRVGKAIPTGVFSTKQAEAYMEKLLAKAGRSNDFRKLKSKLRVVATDLDTGDAVEFGGEGFADIPISKAVLASSALPGVFPPVEIGGRHYVDGALKKTMHASVPLGDGVKLLFCFNPIVPLNTREGTGKTRKLTDTGLPGVLTQTMRSLIHSRMSVGMTRYKTAYPNSDLILFEPDHGDDELFFINIFATSGRRRLCEHAYRSTRAQLWQRRHELAPVLKKHGLQLDLRVLQDESRTLIEPGVGEESSLQGLVRVTGRLNAALDDVARYVKARKG
jgi:NTE family protein